MIINPTSSKTYPCPTFQFGYGKAASQRIIDIINQCRYLASKRGMHLKELQDCIRADEDAQRKTVRNIDTTLATCPQFSELNYGNWGSSTLMPDSWSCFQHKTNSCGHPCGDCMCQLSQPVVTHQADDGLINLLYTASRMSNMTAFEASSSPLMPGDIQKAPIIVKDVSKNSEACLPQRTFANLNLATLCDSGDEDDEGNGSDSDSDDSDCEMEVVEEFNRERTVVSPLIKQVESAYANLRKNDSLFGTMDDFGHMINEASLVL